jgi:hypothetical protein
LSTDALHKAHPFRLLLVFADLFHGYTHVDVGRLKTA